MPSDTQDQPPRGRRSSRRRDYSGAPDVEATAAAAAAAAARSTSRHDGVPRRSGTQSAGPDPDSHPAPAAAPKLGGAQEARGRREPPRSSRVPVAVFVIAVAVAVLYPYFWPPTLANMPITSLRPEDVVIKAAPCPIADLVSVAKLYADSCNRLCFPHRTPSGIALGLDAPGLNQLDIAAWLPNARIDSQEHPELNKSRRLPATLAPVVVDIANVSFTLKMMDTLWPILAHAAKDLLVLSLGRHHPEYPSLWKPLDGVFWGPQRDVSVVYYANKAWTGLRGNAFDWLFDAHYNLFHTPIIYLEWFAAEKAARDAATQKDKAKGDSDRSARPSPSPLAFGFQVPTLAQLVEHDKGWRQTLPRLLAGLAVSDDASSQLTSIMRPLSRFQGGLGTGTSELCMSRNLLDAVAEGRCRGNETSVVGRLVSYDSLGGQYSEDRHYLGGLRDALCDADTFLSYLATSAERARDRARVAVVERGGITTREALAGYFNRDGIVRRTATLDRALHMFHHLQSSLGLHRRRLADMATQMKRACMLQDEVRDRVHSLLYSGQGPWWHLEYNAHNETAELTIVVLPALRDTITQLRAATARLKAQQVPGRYDMRLWNALRELEEKVLSGWTQRLGLAGLPREPKHHWDDPPIVHDSDSSSW
ncbi:hypothetical protein C8A00DRAFT_35172 [Chaetomidium leptoderma]|uniref:Uncharacterized protein n=1 Tax=Chaetomidium leptoderma TaxID=669021 RepID=A0AAN6VIG8_9PEZI|nr:hypothetical protein C8A00DRAFT_35172 [Chaetomidium leptoderma]